MKHCIWCRKFEHEHGTKFSDLAHTIPKSLGGHDICLNVCNVCNHFFGEHYEGLPSVETIIKETFNISRLKFLESENNVGKNKPLTKFSSFYFKVDLKKHKIELKESYSLRSGFQEKICRQIKKGLYKIFLEETERQKNDGHNAKFDFMREFARYNLGDYPVFYFERSKPWIVLPKSLAAHPKFFLDDGYRMPYLVNAPSFFEFEFFGHVFGIATSRHWQLAIDNYINKSMKAKNGYFHSWHYLTNFHEIYLSLRILDNKNISPKVNLL